MKLINKETGIIISDKVIKLGFTGLMFKKLAENKSVLIEVSRESRFLSAVHMFYVFQALDIVWLDKNFKVVDIARNLQPFVPFKMPKEKAKYILEFLAGTAEQKKIKSGDVLEIKE